MIGNLTLVNQQRLFNISQFLILNSSSVKNLGLFHGKMGMVLFFFHYSRYTQKKTYADFAFELINEIYDEINTRTIVDFESGLCGIGWTIEYLIQNHFLEGDTGEILEELDYLIMERDIRRVTNYSFRTGLAGIYYYVFIHTNSPFASHTVFDEVYLNEIKASWWKEKNSLISLPTNLLGQSVMDLPELQTEDLIMEPNKSDFSGLPIGIEKGIIGRGLKIMDL